MVSIEHFAHELRRRLHEAAANGAPELLVTHRELCQSVRSGTAWLNFCCEAMEQEVRTGDTVVHDRSGHGMAVRYRLPRSGS
jgi:hypothetical protein